MDLVFLILCIAFALVLKTGILRKMQIFATDNFVGGTLNIIIPLIVFALLFTTYKFVQQVPMGFYTPKEFAMNYKDLVITETYRNIKSSFQTAEEWKQDIIKTPGMEKKGEIREMVEKLGEQRDKQLKEAGMK